MDNANNLSDWQYVKGVIARHALSRKSPAATPWEGLLLGNADMGAIIFGPSYKLCFRLSKMDLWDARWNEENYRHPLPLSKFKDFIFEASKKLKAGEALDTDLNDSWAGRGTLYPCIRMGADLLVRACRGEPTFPAALTQRLRLEDGLYEAEFAIGWWPSERERIKCTAFVSWQHNVLALRMEIPEHCHNRSVVSLGRDPMGGRSWELLSSGPSIKGAHKPTFERDPREGMLPPSELTVEGNTAFLYQVIPGDKFCPERGFSIVAACAEEGAEFFLEPSGQAALEALDQDSLTLFVSLASEMEAPNSMERAVALSKAAVQEGWDALYAKHAEAWRTFWMQSTVELDDRALERSWVRSQYMLAITARSGRPAPGLCGVSIMNDSPPWRGDRHNNYPEYSSLFWGAFSSNHAEQALNYTEFVHNYLPTARRIAREVFECERGAAFPHCYIDGSQQYWFHYTWAWSLFLTAIHAQNCWWHYQYFGDRDFLENMAYPVMRECANFYVEMVRKNPPGDYTFWPTIATEIRGWTKDFELNRNCIEDLAHIKFLMRAAVEASEILQLDAELRTQWQDILDHLPPYPTIALEGKEEFVDFAGQQRRPIYNHSVPMAPMWPAEDPDVFADTALREMAMNTLAAHDWDHTRMTIACMRLGMKEKVFEKMLGQEKGSCDESNAGFAGGQDAFLMNEMLLTSWDGILRIFPCWPLEMKASFRDLRAKGAFLVSASCEGGTLQEAHILSEKGGLLRILSPWPQISVFCDTLNRPVEAIVRDNILHLDTESGYSYTLQPR